MQEKKKETLSTAILQMFNMQQLQNTNNILETTFLCTQAEAVNGQVSNNIVKKKRAQININFRVNNKYEVALKDHVYTTKYVVTLRELCSNEHHSFGLFSQVIKLFPISFMKIRNSSHFTSSDQGLHVTARYHFLLAFGSQEREFLKNR